MLGYQMKITIKGSKPPIWRRVIVPEGISFYNLDEIIEELFGWGHGHLFSFRFKEAEFMGSPIPQPQDNAGECIDEWMEESGSFLYTYDFGDDWEHTVKVEKVMEYDKSCPVVLKAKGPYMIEDCGGLWGFYEQMDSAEPFDTEDANVRLQTLEFPSAGQPLKGQKPGSLRKEEPEDEDVCAMDEEEMFGPIKEIMDQFNKYEENVKRASYEVMSLSEAFRQYSKDELKLIADYHGFRGSYKFNKAELVEWVKNHLLDTRYMGEFFMQAEAWETKFFEKSIAGGGIIIDEEILEDSLLLGTYGCYCGETGLYQIPRDVQEKYKKICTPRFLEKRKERVNILAYCSAAIYLYGVIPMAEFTKLFNRYEERKMTEDELKEIIGRFIEEGEACLLRKDLLISEELEDMELCHIVLDEQKGYSYYQPDSKEDFLMYAEAGSRQLDESMGLFIEYLMEKQKLEMAQAWVLANVIREAIRMNATEAELIAELMKGNCKLSSQKKQKEVFDQIRKLSCHVRRWELKGHTEAEVLALKADTKRKAGEDGDSKIISFVSGKKIYPNDPCPCGSGKKYKYCCGKK